MSTLRSSGEDAGLVFSWEHPSHIRWALGGFLLASCALHALCFYVFQIIYPPTVALLPPPGRVTVIAPNTSEGRVLLRWLEAEDPALASTTQPSDARKAPALPTIQHAPSYLMRLPALKEPDPPPSEAPIPSSQPPAPVAPLEKPKPVVVVGVPTLINWSPEFEILGTPATPQMHFFSSGPESPLAARFRLAADPAGIIRFAFLEKSSGDASLDEQARKFLVQTRFSPNEKMKSKFENDLIWGTATVEWGNDLAAPPTATESNGQ